MSCACATTAPLECDEGQLYCSTCNEEVGACPGCWDCQDPDVYGQDAADAEDGDVDLGGES